jgi:hypothetical protein
MTCRSSRPPKKVEIYLTGLKQRYLSNGRSASKGRASLGNLGLANVSGHTFGSKRNAPIRSCVSTLDNQ